MNKNKTTHKNNYKQEQDHIHTKTRGARPQSFIELHSPDKHVNKPNNIGKVGLGHALAHLKKI
jgi:hypothetical protein